MDDLISRKALLEPLVNWRNANMGTEAMRYLMAEVIETIDSAPAVDAVPVVRCRECKHSVPIFSRYFIGCDMWKHSIQKDGFCHMGAKMDGGEND